MHTPSEKRTMRNQQENKKSYTRPAIVHEQELETRAGTPLGVPNPLDPTGIDPIE